MAEKYYQHQFANGLTLLAEKMPVVKSAAMSLLVPAGVAADPDGACGTATVLSDLVLRGAGARDSRQLTDYLDSLGLQRGNSVGVHHTHFFAAAVAANVLESLSAYADVLRRPRMPADDFTAARDLTMQALAGIEDEPRQKLMLKLRERHFPSPYGRNATGIAADVAKLTLDACRAHQRQRYVARGSILALAGNVDFPACRAAVEKVLGDWEPGVAGAIPTRPAPGKFHHEPHQSEQTHIGIAYNAIPETHDDYYKLRLAVEVLSGGMSGRLFTEIREKRALVYSVWAGYSALKDRGSVLGYAGTSNERAQATLDCLVAEVLKLGDGVTAAELDRAKTGLKASVIMQGESTSARCGAIAHDYFYRGRIRTLDEIKNAIDGVTVDGVNAYLAANRPRGFTVVTLGPTALRVPDEARA